MKRRIWKTLISMTVVLIMLTATVFSAAAQQAEEPKYRTLRGTWAELSSELKYFSSVFASVNTTSTVVAVGGNVATKASRTVQLTLGVDRSANNTSGWTAVPDKVWTIKFDTMAVIPEAVSRHYNNPVSGYFYRSNLTASCYSGSVLLESVRICSPGKYFPAPKTAAAELSEADSEPIYEVTQLVG